MFDVSHYQDKVPSHLLNALVHWGKQEYITGDFLGAVLSNDLMEAIGRADNSSMASLKHIAMFINNELPRDCHGSKETVAEWRRGFNVLSDIHDTKPAGETR
tara:strand:- start:224 stop:529 length:306 start_codon:yes stop_codon:yes gene_type:complete